MPGSSHESRRASATRDPRIGTGTSEHNGNENGHSNGNGHANGNGHTAARATGLLADEPLQLSPARVPRDPARRAAMEMASAVIVASSAETASHSDDVDVLSEAICRRLELPAYEWENVVIAARLHDIGKIEIPAALLEKPGPLSDAEWAAVHRHTIVGEEIVAAVPELEGVAELVRHSHERWDGGGYPDGIAGERIPLGSRIIACADAYHAMRSDRPYRKGRSAAAAMVELRACAGTQFDPAVVTAFEQVAGGYRGRVPRRLNGRTARLMALLLIVGVGVTGSAIARSGLLDQASATPAWDGHSSRALSTGAAASLGGHVNRLGPAFTTNPGHRNPPGVRDHGAGVGAGKGQGGQHRNAHAKGSGSSASHGGWSGQGQSASAPGHGGSSPGKSEFAPGHGGSSPGNSASAAGHTGSTGSSSSGSHGSSGGHTAASHVKAPHVKAPHVKAPPPSPQPAPPPTSNAGGNGIGSGDGGGKGH